MIVWHDPARAGSPVALALAVALAAAVSAPLAATPASAAEIAGEPGKIEIHGYGEAHYNHPEIDTMDKTAPAEVDVHRMVLGWEYEFTPKLRFEGEIDFEHAATEIELEYAQIEYDLGPTTSLRVGNLLMPVGPLNEFHEPPTYHSVERPYVESYVIPTTWQEVGVGIAGRAGAALGYRAYLVSGLDASGFETLRGIREGRRHGAEAPAENLAVVGRVECASRGGLTVGGSAYFGGADQGTPGLGDATVGILEADARFRRGALDLRGEIVGVGIDNSDSISAVVGEPVGKSLWGANAEMAFDALHRGGADSGRHLWLFGRFERFDTNAKTETGVVADPDAERTVLTGGAAYHPIQDVAFKADFEHWKDGADQELNRFNLGVAFQF